MVNRSGRIGREGEHIAIGYLAGAGFRVSEERGDGGLEREGRRAASLDIISDDLTVPVEVKRRGTLSVPAWTRELEGRHGSEWALFVIQRDARKKLHPDLLIFPAAFGAQLLKDSETLANMKDELAL